MILYFFFFSASIVVIAVPLGSMTSGVFADLWGRLWPAKISVIPTVIGWSLIASANSIPQLLVGRFLTGFATRKHFFKFYG